MPSAMRMARGFPSRWASRCSADLPLLPAMASIALPNGCSGRRGGGASPGFEQCERDGEQGGADEQAKKPERDKAAEHAQDRQAQRHGHANADQKGLDEIVDNRDDE